MDNRDFLMHFGNRNSGRYKRGSGKRPYQHDGMGETQNRPKRASEMSDDELRSAINRMRMEQQYNELINSSAGRKQIRDGKSFVKSIFDESGRDIGKQMVKYFVGSSVNAATGKRIINVGGKK